MVQPGISLGQPAHLTLSTLQTAFAGVRDGQHLRFSDAKGLHIHGSLEPTKADFLSKFRVESGLAERAALRDGAVQHVKTAIDAEYGKGMGERVFTRMTTAGSLSGGVTVGDLAAIRTEADALHAADTASAEARVGTSLATVLHDLSFQNSSLGPWTHGGTDDLRDRMAAAVNALPPGATPAQCRRAAEGVVVFDQAMRLAADTTNGTGKGYGVNAKVDMQELVATCFSRPPGPDTPAVEAALYARPTSQVLAAFEQLSRTCDTRSAGAFLQIIDMPFMTSGEKTARVGDLVEAETKTSILNKSTATYLRNAEVAPAFELTKPGVGEYFGPRLDAAKQLLQRPPGQELTFMKAELERSGRPPGDAIEALQAFDDAMTLMIGGSTPDEIRASADAVPQEVCDMLKASREGVKRGLAELERDGKLPNRAEMEPKLLRMADQNFMFLRGAAAMVTTDSRLNGDDRTAMGFAAFLGNVGAGTTPASGKLPDGANTMAAPIFAKWGDACAQWFDAIAARGQTPATF